MFTRKGQSILEYAILLAVVIAVLLIMQAFVKRGYQGSLKKSADSMGEQFSADGTTIMENQSMTGSQDIVSEVATTAATMNLFSDRVPTGVTIKGTLDNDAYSLNTRKGGVITAISQTKTESASRESARLNEFQNEDLGANFTDSDLP